MKQMQKKRTVKGMTLMECIIAILVVGIAGTVMCVAGTSTKRFIMNANHINNKVEAEVSVGSGTSGRDTLAGYTGGNGEETVNITVGTYGTVEAKRYSTKSADDEFKNSTGKPVDTNLDASNTALRFYTFD